TVYRQLHPAVGLSMGAEFQHQHIDTLEWLEPGNGLEIDGNLCDLKELGRFSVRQMMQDFALKGVTDAPRRTGLSLATSQPLQEPVIVGAKPRQDRGKAGYRLFGAGCECQCQ